MEHDTTSKSKGICNVPSRLLTNGESKDKDKEKMMKIIESGSYKLEVTVLIGCK